MHNKDNPKPLSEMTREELLAQVESLSKQKEALIKENQSWRRKNALLKQELKDLTK
jgi:cell division protein FtsB